MTRSHASPCIHYSALWLYAVQRRRGGQDEILLPRLCSKPRPANIRSPGQVALIHIFIADAERIICRASPQCGLEAAVRLTYRFVGRGTLCHEPQRSCLAVLTAHFDLGDRRSSRYRQQCCFSGRWYGNQAAKSSRGCGERAFATRSEHIHYEGESDRAKKRHASLVYKY